jgi:hypothetical protein
MDDYLNIYVGKILKDWVGSRNAPKGLKAHILLQAAKTPMLKPRKQRLVVVTHNYKPTRWDHLLLSCDIIHSYQSGLTVSRMVV